MGQGDSAPAVSAQHVDYGKMWDKHSGNLPRLAKEAGIPASWMRVDAHRPKNRDDFISKMNSAYYTNFSAAGHGDDALPICVGLALTTVICTGLLAKYGKVVSPKAVIASIYAVCPEMFEEGIRPNEAIDRCNQAQKQRGLIIPGSDNDVYWIQLKPEVFTHRDYFQAWTMVECLEKHESRAMVITVVPDLDVPLHAMVASSVGYGKGGKGAEMSAFDLQCEEDKREQVVSQENFHQLIVCNIDAKQQLRGETQKIDAQAGFQEQFQSNLSQSRSVTRLKQPRSCGPLSCGRAQMDALTFDDSALLESIKDAQDSFAQMRLKFQALKDNFKREFAGDFPRELLDTFRSSPLEAAQSFSRIIASQVSSARSEDQMQQRLVEVLEQSGFEQRLVKVLEQSGFDEEMKQGFRLGAEDLLRSLARRCSMR